MVQCRGLKARLEPFTSSNFLTNFVFWIGKNEVTNSYIIHIFLSKTNLGSKLLTMVKQHDNIPT